MGVSLTLHDSLKPKFRKKTGFFKASQYLARPIAFSAWEKVVQYFTVIVNIIQPCNYQLSKSIFHEIKFGDIAVM